MWMKKKKERNRKPARLLRCGSAAGAANCTTRSEITVAGKSDRFIISFTLLPRFLFYEPQSQYCSSIPNWSAILLGNQLVTNHRFHWKTRVKERDRVDKMMLKKDNGNADQLQVDHDREAPDPGDRSAPLSLTHTCKARGQIRDLCQS